MDSNSWAPGFRPHRAKSTLPAPNLTEQALLEANPFVLETCSCRICRGGKPADLQSFAAEVCPCQVCRTNTDKDPSRPPTNLSTAA